MQIKSVVHTKSFKRNTRTLQQSLGFFFFFKEEEVSLRKRAEKKWMTVDYNIRL